MWHNYVVNDAIDGFIMFSANNNRVNLLFQITLKSNAPMQVDGEPWEQHAATMHIKHHNQATMLANIADEVQ